MGILYPIKKEKRKNLEEINKENNNKVHVWIWTENSSSSFAYYIP
jgi:hypothetical protein